jgi:glycosyltransferase involved in cell wall biosynthesis
MTRSMNLLSTDNKEREEGGRRLKGSYKKTFPNNPLVTVITVVYNCQKHIEKAILSVIEQTYNNIEYIIIDGGSTDGTLDIIKKYDKHIDYWISENDQGIYHAWNKGVTHAHGDWLSFLGADDEYFIYAINEYIDLINDSDKIKYISSRIELIENENTLRVIGRQWQWSDFKRYMNVAHVGSLHARSMYHEKGLYDLEFKIAGDYEFLLRFGPSMQTAFLDKVTVKMRTEGVSNSSAIVFIELAKAKILHTSRSRIIIYLETVYAFIKWKITK